MPRFLGRLTLARLRAAIPRLAAASDAEIEAAKFALHDAQRILAQEYGFETWVDLVHAVAPQSSNPTQANAPFSTDELIEYFAAVRDLDLAAVRRCLEANPTLTEARINDKGMNLRGAAFSAALRDESLTEHTSTAIHLAANSFLDHRSGAPGSGVELIKILLDFDADPNAVGFNENTGHCTPIVIASWEGGVEKMRLLLEAGADVSGEQGQAALSTAANHASIDRFDLLIEYGASASTGMLINAGLVDRVLKLVDADPALLSQRDENGATLLQVAATRVDRWYGEDLAAAAATLAKALIERGAPVDIFVAAALNDQEALKAILRDEPDQRDAQLGDGTTALECATRAGSLQAADLLLEAGADPKVGAKGLLLQASRLDDTEICRRLIQYGAEVDDEIVTAATWRNKEPECVRLILQHGGNPNALVGGWGAIHWASGANTEAVRLLLAAGADVNAPAPGRANYTPLHFALGNVETVEVLLEAGADTTRVNANGETALDVAVREGRTEVVELLQRRVQ